MQIKMAESTQRAGLDAWELRRRGRLPVLLHASPLTTLDLRAPLVRLTAGLRAVTTCILVCGYLKCEFRSYLMCEDNEKSYQYENRVSRNSPGAVIR